jgi:DNA (cytosine-5)-methyltransferase 1
MKDLPQWVRQTKRALPKKNGLTCAGLFAGCGGLDLGAALAGFETVYAADSDPVAVSTYKRNVSPQAECIDLSTSKISNVANGVDLLLGGPPCQGFSSAGPKQASDPRNKLWSHYLDYVRAWQPKIFLMENVPGFLRELPAFSNAVQEALNGSYKVFARRFVTQYYRVPQFRDRIIVQGLRCDVSNEPLWPQPTDTEVYNYTRQFDSAISMAAALEDLGPPELGSEFPDHRAIPLRGTDALVARHIPNGGSLKNIPDKHLPAPYYGRERTSKGWTWFYRKPRPELPGRGVIASVRPNYATILAPDVHSVRRDGVWSWTPVNSEEHTDSSGLYTSPLAPRRLTIRECARLQTFPDWFRFCGSPLEAHRQIGNAVPVEFARQLTEAIARVLIGDSISGFSSKTNYSLNEFSHA